MLQCPLSLLRHECPTIIVDKQSLDRTLNRTSIASVLYSQVPVVDQPVDDGAGPVETEVLEVLPFTVAALPSPSPLLLASAFVRID